MYREGVKWAVESMHTGNLRKDGRRASELLALMNIKVSDTTLHLKLREYVASLEPDVTVVNVQTPCRTGQRAKLPMRYEVQLVEFVQKLRALNLKAGKSLIVGAANHLIKGTELADLFKDKQVTYAWYYSFRNRYGIKMKNQVRLEMDRKRWTTSDHFCSWYDVVMDGMIQCGIAVKNDSFKDSEPYDIMFYVTDPDMVFEWDQTGFTLDQTDDGKGPTEKTMTVDSDDDGTCVVNKSSVRWTLTGGSFMNGDASPGCATPPSKSMQLSLMKDPPRSNLIDPETGGPSTMPVLPASLRWVFVPTCATLVERGRRAMSPEEGRQKGIWAMRRLWGPYNNANGDGGGRSWHDHSVACATHQPCITSC